MPDADGLRLRAIRYLAMAFKAREDGEADFAQRLDERATELMEEAATLARMRLRGLSGARDEFVFAAIVQNLKTLALRTLKPPPTQPHVSLA